MCVSVRSAYIEKCSGVNESSCINCFECPVRVEKLCIRLRPFTIFRHFMGVYASKEQV